MPPVKVHPLALLQITDHATRTRLRNKSETSCIGALLGSFTTESKSDDLSGQLEIVTAFELPENSARPARLAAQLAQFKQVLKDLIFVGWYHCSPDDDQKASTVTHNALEEFARNETANAIMPFVMLQYTSSIKNTDVVSSVDADAELPIQLMIQVSGQWQSLPYTIESSDAERITVQQIATSHDSHEQVPPLVSHLQAHERAILMLRSKLQVIHKYLETGTDAELLRRISSFLSRFPAASEDQLLPAIEQDTLLVASADVMTQSLVYVSMLCEAVQSKVRSEHNSSIGGSMFPGNSRMKQNALKSLNRQESAGPVDWD